MSCRRNCRFCLLGFILVLVIVVSMSYILDREGTIFLIATAHYALFSSESTIEAFLESARLLEMKKEEKAVLLDLTRRFDSMWSAHNLTYVSSFGSVLGFVRHGTFVPWDDDYDVMVPATQRKRMEALFRSSAGSKARFNLRLHKYSDYSYKVTPLTNVRKNMRPWGWPFIDIFLYDDYPNYVHVPMLAHAYVPKNMLFPIRRTAFDASALLVNMPRCPWHIARQEFGDLNRCCTGKWNHRLEKAAPTMPRCISCHRIKRHFPFLTARTLNRSAVQLEARRGERRLWRRVSVVSLCEEKPKL